jgi:hypothetical protein
MRLWRTERGMEERLGKVGTRITAGAARGAVGGHLACTQGHQGSGVDTMGRSEGTTRKPRGDVLAWDRKI